MSNTATKTCHWENGKLIRCPNNKVKTIKNHFCQHCGGDLRKPLLIEPGVFGKFSDSDKPMYNYDYLQKVEDTEQFPYVDANGEYWELFKPGLPAEKIEVEAD
jgi:rRNA maturation protein Nop10